MKYDLQQPALVLLGNWNPAIFQPGWMATTFFGYPEGVEISATFVETALPAKRTVTFLKNLGIAATPERVEIYINDLKTDTFGCAEELARKVYETLPHTPIGPFGVNFSIVGTEAPEQVRTRLRVSDGSDGLFEVKEHQLLTRFAYDKSIDLNFRRGLSADGKVTFAFNFHYVDANARNAATLVKDVLSKCFGETSAILKKLYEIEISEAPQTILAQNQEA